MTSVSAQQHSSFGRIADSSAAPDKRFHEKLWIIDGGTDRAMAVTGGLNIGNNYFRANPADPDNTWRDQDVVLRGAIVDNLVTAFDRHFDYFVAVTATPRISHAGQLSMRIAPTSGSLLDGRQ